ncbi:hypothetical protein HG605_01860 [Streptococcus pneumoniae]|nr:hypothetical protein HG605_01860 [Streptococcus pneumoniae]
MAELSIKEASKYL